ncbi:MAG: GNAT family N-acetyltransferase [Huintestinicola sp.]
MNTANYVLLNKVIEQSFYKLVAEYLPGSDHIKMREYAEQFPNLFIAVMLGSEIIGVAYGWHRKIEHPDDDSFVLDGIAVKNDYRRKGYGRQLLSAFEKAAVSYGASTISIGSAGGYVEKFYISCGYMPKEYKIRDNSSTIIEKTFENLQDYNTYKRKNDDGFIVMEKKL